MAYGSSRSLRQQDQSDVAAQQQQERLPPVRIPPYPVQAPPIYTQVDSSRVSPPPLYQPPEAERTPPLSPFMEPSSPFEDLTPETEPNPTLPIPIPSVDVAAKAIEAKQAMLVNRNNGRTIQTTAVIEPHVAALSLEDSLSNVEGTGTLRPQPASMLYREQQSGWPSADSVGGSNSGNTHNTPHQEALNVSQIQTDKSLEVFPLSLADPENTLESPPSDLQNILPEFSPEEELDSIALPKFAPSGQVSVSEQPRSTAGNTPTTQLSRIPVDQESPSSTSSSHKLI